MTVVRGVAEKTRQGKRPVVLLCLKDDGVRYRMAHWLHSEAVVRVVDSAATVPPDETTAIICDDISAASWIEQTRFVRRPPSIHVIVESLDAHANAKHTGRGAMLWERVRAKELATVLARHWRVFAHDATARAWETLRVAEQAGLTPRQSEILLLASMELTPDEAGDRLDISAMTVKEHFKAIRRKTKVSVGVLCRRIRDNALQLQSASRGPT